MAGAATSPSTSTSQASSATPRILRGVCQCTSTAYYAADTFDFAFLCHCSLCRRSTGSAFKALASIPLSHIRIMKGAKEIMKVAYDKWHDERCGKCGSLLYAVTKRPEGLCAYVAMGTLVDEPSVQIMAHVFVGSKASWDVLPDDGLPRYDKGLPEDARLAMVRKNG